MKETLMWLLVVLALLVIPVALLSRRMKETWPFLVTVTLLLTCSVAENWLESGFRDTKSIVLHLAAPALLAVLTLVEIARSIIRAGGPVKK